MDSIENKVSTGKIHTKLTAVHKMRMPRYGNTLRQVSRTLGIIYSQ